MMMKKMEEMLEMLETVKLALSQKIEDSNAELKSQIETKVTKLAKEVTELRSTVKTIERKSTDSEMIKACNTVMIYHCGLLHGVYETNRKALNTYFVGKDLHRDIYDITVIRSGEHVHCSVQCVSPMAVSRVRTAVISSVMELKENNKHFKPKATDDDKNLYIAVESFIPSCMKETNKTLGKYGAKLKKEKQIISYSTSIRTFGPPGDRTYKLVLHTKESKGAMKKTFTAEDIPAEKKRNADHFSPQSKTLQGTSRKRVDEADSEMRVDEINNDEI